MPIYAYRCEVCGHAKDVLQKMSDDPLTVCPACGAEAFRKQVTAAGFQLKGSGWYVTDFRDKGGAKPGAKADTGGDDKPAPGATDGKSGDKPAAPPAPAASPAPASAPAPAVSPSGGSGS
jgi:putative FmdB family regulatory protein